MSSGGGVLKLFFDGVCGPRSETLTFISGFFSLKKRLISFFSKFSQIGTHFLGFFYLKMADFTIFSWFLRNGILFEGFFWPKWDPCLRIFAEKVTHLGGTSLYALTYEYPPPCELPFYHLKNADFALCVTIHFNFADFPFCWILNTLEGL